jgi:hypothetical protein
VHSEMRLYFVFAHVNSRQYDLSHISVKLGEPCVLFRPNDVFQCFSDVISLFTLLMYGKYDFPFDELALQLARDVLREQEYHVDSCAHVNTPAYLLFNVNS